LLDIETYGAAKERAVFLCSYHGNFLGNRKGKNCSFRSGFDGYARLRRDMRIKPVGGRAVGFMEHCNDLIAEIHFVFCQPIDAPLGLERRG